MRVCFFGTFEEDYPRNQILLKALQIAGYETVLIHHDIWRNKIHKTHIIRRVWGLILIALKLLLIYPWLIIRYLCAPKHAVVLVGYPGHLDTVIIKWFAALKRTPVLWDAFISLYDSAIDDRKLVRTKSLTSHALFALDRLACQSADKIILDTDGHIRYFSSAHRIPLSKFVRIYAGAEDDLFLPSKAGSAANDKPYFRILFVGKFTPLHGIQTIIAAAEILKSDRDMMFDLVGTGQLFSEIQNMVNEKKMENVSLPGWVPYRALPDLIQNCDVCLGIFSDSPKLNRVIPNKIFQALATKKPVVTAETDAVKELLRPGKDVLTVPPQNPEALAQLLTELKKHKKLRDQTAESGYNTFHQHADLLKISEELQHTIREMVFL